MTLLSQNLEDMADTVILRKVYALDSNTGLFLSSNQSLITDGRGGAIWIPLISSLTVAGGPIIGDLPSTISTQSTMLWSSFGEISSLWSTTNALSTTLYNITPGNVDPADLISTVDGLGTAGFVSTSGLSNALVSTATGLGTIGYISSASLVSTISSLGTIGYVSTSWLNSTINGLGAYYFSSQSLASSITSSITGLGSVGYISSSWFTSTITGLGTLGYVSSASLDSTTISLLSRPVNFNSASNIIVNSASTVSIGSATNVYYTSSFYLAMSSFYNSTCAVSGSVQSNVTASLASSSNMIFSTAIFNLSNFSPLLSSNSRVTIEYQPTFIFSAPTYSGYLYPTNLTMMTQVAFGNPTNLMITSTANQLYTYASNSQFSTIFQPYIKMTLPSNVVQNMLLNSNTFMVHKIQGGYSSGGYFLGFNTATFTVFCPTSSVMISIQNQLT